jgi:hypothetical protein
LILKLVPRLFPSRPAITRPARRRAARSAVAAGLLTFLALTAALGLAAERYPRVRDPFYGDKLVKLQAKLNPPDRGPAVVMLGSSRTGFAFHGHRVEDRAREAGRPVVAFNFGIPASGPVTQLLYARRLARDGASPDLLLLEIHAAMFADLGERSYESFWLYGDRLTYRELSAVEPYGFDPAAMQSRWRESTFIPWHGLRFQLLGRVAQSWVPWRMRYDWSRTTDACGWGTPLRETLTAEEREQATRQARDEYQPLLRDWHPGEPATAALRQVLTECAATGVAVKLVLLPEGKSFRDLYPPGSDRVLAFANAVATVSGCELIDARGWLPDDAFTDGHHQLRSGAEAFSDRLTREVVVPWARER